MSLKVVLSLSPCFNIGRAFVPRPSARRVDSSCTNAVRLRPCAEFARSVALNLKNRVRNAVHLQLSHGSSREVRLLHQKIEFEFELDFRESTPYPPAQCERESFSASTKWQALSEMISIP
jgi:hypothetical protein